MTRKRACRVNELYPWKEAPDGSRLCAVCEKPMKSKLKYCSSECTDIAYIATSPSYARQKVRRRDKGVCAKCGLDTAKLERIINQLRWGPYAHPGAERRWPPMAQFTWMDLNALRRDLGFVTKHLWEMDHINPVSHGGGLCGLDNLRTLCVPCHRAETARMRKRKKPRRKWTEGASSKS